MLRYLKIVRDITLRNIFRIAVFTVIAISLFFLLEKDKVKRLENSIKDFQKEYKQYIAKDGNYNELESSNTNDSGLLSKYYEEFKNNTLKNFEKDFILQVYDFKFLKGQNILNYTNVNQESYRKLIDENDKIVIELEKEYKVKKINDLKNNNRKLKKIATDEIDYDKLIVNDYEKAKKNYGTTNKILGNCFNNQENTVWKYSSDISRKYCYQLGLKSCKLIFTTLNDKSKNDKKTFTGLSLNNPMKISEDSPYLDYVSYENNDFRTNSANVFSASEEKNIVYPEVYVKEKFGRKIYKYNVVAIPKTYELGCKFPIVK